MEQTDQRVRDDLARFDSEGRLVYRDRLVGPLLLTALLAAAAYFFMYCRPTRTTRAWAGSASLRSG